MKPTFAKPEVKYIIHSEYMDWNVPAFYVWTPDEFEFDANCFKEAKEFFKDYKKDPTRRKVMLTKVEVTRLA